MTKQPVPPLRRRVRRTAFVTGAVILLSLSVSPGARADEGEGPLGGVTDSVGDVTDPVVEPVTEAVVGAVQPVVPQPAQQAVAPVVAPVVQPVVSHAEQAVAPVPGADRVTQPVVRAAESVVRPAERPREEPAGGSADPAVGSVPASAPAPAAGGGSVPGAAGAGGGQDPTTSDVTPHGQGPSGFAPCEGLTDLPPRGLAAPVVAQQPGTSAASGPSAYGVDDLVATGSAADRSGTTDVPPPAARLGDVPWFESSGGGLGPQGRSSTIPVLSGLLGLVGLVLLGFALGRSRQRA